MSATNEIIKPVLNYLMEMEEGKLSENKFTCFPYNFDQVSTVGENLLPNELLVKVLQFLPFADLRACSLVSKRWRTLSLCPILWKKLMLDEVNITIDYLERLIHCNVQKLRLKNSEVFNLLFETKCKESKFDKLQDFRIDYTTITSVLLQEIVLMAPNLKTFVLRNSCDIDKNFLNELLNLKLLQKLHLYGISMCTLEETIDVLEKSKAVANITSFGLGNMFGSISLSESIHIRDALSTGNRILERYLSLLPNLQRLRLEEFSYFYIDDTILKIIATLKNLRNLNTLGTSIKITLEAKETLEKCLYFVSLKKLRISCSATMVEELTMLLSATPNVEILHLSEVHLTPDIFKKITNLGNLKKLDMNVIGIKSPSLILKNINHQNLGQLSSLRLENKCYNLEKHFLENLLSYCNNLKDLLIISYSVEQTILKEIVKMKRLEKLQIFCFPPVNFSKITFFPDFHKLYELKKLNLQIETIFPIEVIVSGTPNLTHLCVTNCSLKKEFLFCIQSLTMLQELRCLKCMKINSNALHQLDEFPKLDKLVCLQVSYYKYEPAPKGLEMLLSLCPKMQKLYLCEVHVTKRLFECIKEIKELEYLELIQITWAPNCSIVKISKNCPKLVKRKTKVVSYHKNYCRNFGAISTVNESRCFR